MFIVFNSSGMLSKFKHREKEDCLKSASLLVNGAGSVGFAKCDRSAPQTTVTRKVGKCCEYAASCTGVQCEVNCY